MRPIRPLLTVLIAGLAVTGTANAQSGGYVGIGLTQNVFFSPSGQPFRSAANQPYPVSAWVAQADTDKDGKISHDEFLADALAFYDKLDVNHDNYINSPENTRYESQVAPEIQRVDPRIKQPTQRTQAADPDMGANQDPSGGRYRKQIIGATQYGLIDEPQPVRAADANFDFRVSKEEWINATNQRFTILDRNEDGFITADEMPKTPAQIAGEVTPDEKAGKGKKKRSGLW